MVHSLVGAATTRIHSAGMWAFSMVVSKKVACTCGQKCMLRKSYAVMTWGLTVLLFKCFFL